MVTTLFTAFSLYFLSGASGASQVAEDMLKLVNRERKINGNLPPLCLNQ
jgi:hypothetical protein